MTAEPTQDALFCPCGGLAVVRGLCTTCQQKLAATPGPPPGQRPSAVVVEDVEWLLETGETHPETVAIRCGYRHVDSLYVALRRAGRDDLIDIIQEHTRRQAAWAPDS